MTQFSECPTPFNRGGGGGGPTMYYQHGNDGKGKCWTD